MKTTQAENSGNKISRQAALKKAGKYAAFTAAASVILLLPKKAQAQSGADGAGNSWNTGGYTPPASGGSTKSSPFTQPEPPSSSSSGLRNSPWK